MARARNIKPGFFKNADLVELPFEARLLFIGLWTLADRAGRLEDRPKQIKMELFPADSIDCDSLLDGLQKAGFIDRYEHSGKRYLHILNFNKHQNPHRDEKASTIPAKDENNLSTDKEQESHSASTVQAQCKNQSDTMPIVLIPDSLIPDSLIPDSLIQVSDTHTGTSREGVRVNLPENEISPNSQSPPKTANAQVTWLMRKAGIADVNPSHPKLAALLEAGAQIEEFRAAAEVAVIRKKGFAYALAIVEKTRQEAKDMATTLHRGQLPVAETTYQRSMRERMAEVAPDIARPDPNVAQFFNSVPNVIEVQHEPAHRLG